MDAARTYAYALVALRTSKHKETTRYCLMLSNTIWDTAARLHVLRCSNSLPENPVVFAEWQINASSRDWRCSRPWRTTMTTPDDTFLLTEVRFNIAGYIRSCCIGCGCHIHGVRAAYTLHGRHHSK